MLEDAIVIVSAARTPIGNFQGCFQNVTAIELGATVIKAVVERAQLQATDIQEVLMGCVLPAGLGQAPARQAALQAGLAVSTPCTTINKVCGSSMKAVMLGYDMLRAGSKNCILAGGMESMTNAPYLLPKARAGYRMGHQVTLDHMLFDGLEDAYQQGCAMGTFAEACVKQFHLTREDQDQFAITSIMRAKKAQDEGDFTAEIAPIKTTTKQGEIIISQDEGPCKAKMEKIPLLKPAFATDGTITAANSSSISDGAAALILMRQSEALKHGLKPLVTIMGHSSHAQEPSEFTTAPITAIQKLLESLNWTVDEVDLFEINEAFAAVTLAAMQALKLPHAKVNIHGGACILGHPLGATGARILVTLIYAMQKYQLKRGIAALCIGGGESTAIAVELT